MSDKQLRRGQRLARRMEKAERRGPLPAEGGSYLRQADGGLAREAAEAAAARPAGKPSKKDR